MIFSCNEEMVHVKIHSDNSFNRGFTRPSESLKDYRAIYKVQLTA